MVKKLLYSFKYGRVSNATWIIWVIRVVRRRREGFILLCKQHNVVRLKRGKRCVELGKARQVGISVLI